MTPERWAQIEELFHRAAECDPKQRAGLLEEACYSDSELRREVEALLASEETASDDMQAAVRCGLEAVTFPLVGEIISHYRILDGLGGGGMGSVYRAEDIKLGRQVALKFLPQESIKNPAALRRFEREARAASALEHPNICPIYEFGEHEGQPFLAMQLLKGQTLREAISTPDRGRVPLPVGKLLDLAIQIASGLEAAHSQGIIHRDIKPANMFVTTQGQAIILDFGLAKLFHREAIEDERQRTPHEFATGKRQTSWKVTGAACDPLVSLTGAAIGTAGYMSPEQVRGERLDARTDLFSFGAVLYEMATGQMAFFGNSDARVFESITEGTQTPVTGVNREIPSELEHIVNKALEKERKHRYQSADEIRADLQRLKRDSDLGRAAATTTTIESKPAAKSSWFRWMWPVAATLLIIALAAGSRLFSSRKSSGLTDKDTIFLAEFTNNTDNPVFDGTLRQGLAIQLEQSPFLSLVSEQRIQQTLQMMGQKPDAKLTSEIARELCQRTGSAAVLDGAIGQVGTKYLLTLKAVDCASGESLASTEAQASDENHVLDALGKTASEIRARLGESLSTLQKFDTPLEVTTPSLEALKTFNLGMKTWETKGETEAIPFFKRAIELDPNFAVAHTALGTCYFNTNQFGLANGSQTRAFELRDRVSERERGPVLGNYYSNALGDEEKAIQAYELWAKSYPRDDIAYLQLGDAYALLGQWERAFSETQESVRLEPNDVVAQSNLMQNFLALNRLDEANAAFQQALARNLDYGTLRLMMYYLSFLRNDSKEMNRHAEWAAGKPHIEDAFLSAQSDSEAYYGHFRKAQYFSRLAVESALRAGANEAAATWQADDALRNAEFGNREQARKSATTAIRISSDSNVRKFAALALARAGDAARTQALVEEMKNANPAKTLLNHYWLATTRGAIALGQNNPANAIELLQPAGAFELGYSMPFQLGTLYPAYVRGEAYLALHQGLQAAAEYQKILDHRGIVLNFPLGALAHLQLGRAYAMQGDTAKAKAAYRDFLTLWKDADPDIRILKQAKAEYTKLQ